MKELTIIIPIYRIFVHLPVCLYEFEHKSHNIGHLIEWRRRNSRIDLSPFRCPEESLQFGLHSTVAFAGRIFEPRLVRDSHASTRVLDQAGLLQRARGNRYAGTLNAEHHRQEFLGQRKRLCQRAVVGDQQPETTALLQTMQPIAGSNLHDLASGKTDALMHRIKERIVLFHLTAKDIAPNPHCRSWNLNNGPYDCLIDTEERAGIGYSFYAYGSHLDRSAVLHGLDQ